MASARDIPAMSGRRRFSRADASTPDDVLAISRTPVLPGPGEHARLSFSERGRHHLLRGCQWVPAPLEECFAFFSDAANLEAVTPPFLRFRILTPLPIEMRTGALIEYRLNLMGLPLPWLTRIEDWRPGVGFTDVQLRGPYARWVHRHAFESAGAGTWIRDEVEYGLPLAWLSGPIHALFVRPRLREIFSYRQQAVARLLG